MKLYIIHTFPSVSVQHCLDTCDVANSQREFKQIAACWSRSVESYVLITRHIYIYIQNSVGEYGRDSYSKCSSYFPSGMRLATYIYMQNVKCVYSRCGKEMSALHEYVAIIIMYNTSLAMRKTILRRCMSF